MRIERRELVLGRGAIALGVILALGAVLYWLRGVLTPIFLAFAIAYVLDPVVDRLEAWKLPRGVAIFVVLGVFFLGVAGFALLVIPDVVRDISTVVRELPDHASRALARAEPWLTARGVSVPATADVWLEKLRSNANALSKVPLEPVGNLLKTVIGGTFSAIGAIFAALIVPILAVYFLNDFDRMIAGTKALLPLAQRERVSSIAREVDAVLSQFVRGQLTVMAILAVLYALAYSLLGIRLAIPIGIAAGVLNIVPYVGSAFALVAGLLMSLLGGGSLGQILGVVIAYAVVQTLEGFVITPRIVGESVGLREVWVLLALFVGGEIFGFLGVLLAVPAAAVLKIFFGHAVARYKQSRLYLVMPDGSLGAVPDLDAAVAPSERAPPNDDEVPASPWSADAASTTDDQQPAEFTSEGENASVAEATEVSTHAAELPAGGAIEDAIGDEATAGSASETVGDPPKRSSGD